MKFSSKIYSTFCCVDLLLVMTARVAAAVSYSTCSFLDHDVFDRVDYCLLTKLITKLFFETCSFRKAFFCFKFVPKKRLNFLVVNFLVKILVISRACIFEVLVKHLYSTSRFSEFVNKVVFGGIIYFMQIKSFYSSLCVADQLELSKTS